MVRWCRKYQLE